jgi:hypothetical protein
MDSKLLNEFGMEPEISLILKSINRSRERLSNSSGIGPVEENAFTLNMYHVHTVRRKGIWHLSESPPENLFLVNWRASSETARG